MSRTGAVSIPCSIIVAAWAALFASVLPTRSAPPNAGEQSGEVRSSPGKQLHGADLVGATVETSDGQVVGAVDDLTTDSHGADVLVIGLAGALGLGERDVAVPLSDVTRSRPYPEAGLHGAASATGLYAGSRGILVTVKPDLAALLAAPPFTAGAADGKSGRPSPRSGVPEGVTTQPKSSTQSGGPG